MFLQVFMAKPNRILRNWY